MLELFLNHSHQHRGVNTFTGDVPGGEPEKIVIAMRVIEIARERARGARECEDVGPRVRARSRRGHEEWNLCESVHGSPHAANGSQTLQGRKPRLSASFRS